MPDPQPQTYAVARAVRVQLLGAVLVGAGLVVGLLALLVSVAGLPGAVLTGAVGVAVLLVVAVALRAGRRGWVLRLDDVGYRLRRVRGVGAPAAAWADVVSLATGESGSRRVLELRLRDGRVTHVPVDLLGVDPDDLVRVVSEHLGRAPTGRAR